MGKFSLKKIGEFINKTSKRGNATIQLVFYPNVLKHIAPHDFEKGIYLMPETMSLVAPFPNAVDPHKISESFAPEEVDVDAPQKISGGWRFNGEITQLVPHKDDLYILTSRGEMYKLAELD